MLKVVSNSTPLISLLKLNRLELLEQLYSQINIPVAVYCEIEAGKNKIYYQDLSKLEWINIVEIREKTAVEYFIDLHAGEAETIVLAKEMKSDLVILDEKLGRNHAKQAGLKVTGTIGVLIKAKNNGLISALKPFLDELTEKGVWISENLKKEILKVVDEV